MAYEDLLKSVEESAVEQERELQRKAAVAIEEIKARAKKQAEAVRQAHTEGAGKSLVAERNKQLYITKAESKELLIKTRESAFERAFAAAEARLKDLRADPEYPRIFEKLLREAATALGAEAFAVHVDPKDEALCRKTLAALQISGEILPDLQSAGGVILSLPGNAVVISNTVETRLLRAKEHNRHMVHAILSGD
jgi:V/A-type H+-transporting ATPase subunit E